MTRLSIALGLAFTLAVLSSKADELKAATKGKNDPVQTYYGDIQSYSNGQLAFAVPQPRPAGASPGGSEAIIEQLEGPQTMQVLFKPEETEIVITLNVHDPQDPVTGLQFEMSTPDRKSKDLDLELGEYQKAKEAKDRAQQDAVPEKKDLSKCSAADVDLVIETDSNGNARAPVAGKMTDISNGIASLKRQSDGQSTRYRLEDLKQIILGACPAASK